MTVRTTHIREMLQMAHALAAKAEELGEKGQPELGSHSRVNNQIYRCLERAQNHAVHAMGELQDELLRFTYGDDMDQRLLHG